MKQDKYDALTFMILLWACSESLNSDLLKTNPVVWILEVINFLEDQLHKGTTRVDLGNWNNSPITIFAFV